MGNRTSRISQSEPTPMTARPVARRASAPSQSIPHNHTTFSVRRASTGVMVRNDNLTEQVLAWSASCKKRPNHDYQITDENYLCPICLKIPIVPVLLSGRVYELDVIADHIRKKHKDPMTQSPAYLMQIQPYLNFFDLLAERHAAENPAHMRVEIRP